MERSVCVCVCTHDLDRKRKETTLGVMIRVTTKKWPNGGKLHFAQITLHLLYTMAIPCTIEYGNLLFYTQ